MGRLVYSAFMTLDGVIEAPGFEEHRSGRNAWALRISDEAMQHHNRDEFLGADAILLGRTTYQIWAAFWAPLADEPVFGRRINELPKYVVSRTLERADWNNTTILRGDLATEITEFKQRIEGEILVQGSADLAAGLMELGLIDEYRLMLYPIILGSGKRLFRDEADMHHLRLIGVHTFDPGVVLLRYEPVSETPAGEFATAYTWTEGQVESLHAAQDTNRVLATVMFTDIVDSTGRAAALGDRQWRQLLDRHDEIARAQVEQWHGQVVKTTGDGILATFDAPSRALRCAFALRSALAARDLEIRVAIHTGEIERRGADIGGIGVHIAARALSDAEQSGVVVTRTVRELATGADLSFRSLGSVGLRGVPGQWELFEAALGHHD